ncbi:MAG: cell surface protein SprA [Calditrichaeota bacterium]|nr:cell surface protein SprA [Calditrichota bacterium]
MSPGLVRGGGRIYRSGLLALLVSFGIARAEVGFRYVSPYDHLIDPVRFPPRIGLSSSPRDTTKIDTSAAADSAAAEADSLQPEESARYQAPSDSLLPTPSDSLPDDSLGTFAPDDTSGLLQPDTGRPAPLKDSGTLPSGTAAGVTGSDTGPPGTLSEAPADSARMRPVPVHPTIVRSLDLTIEQKSAYDSSTGYVVLTNRFPGLKQPHSGALPPDDYLRFRARAADRESRRKTVLGKYPKSVEKSGTGIDIQIPVFRSPGAQRIFGGSNIGLSVTGNIEVSGGLTTERKNEIARNQSSPTNYVFKVDQKQQFNIKGKVGEKVSVEIDQDSEKLFEFENSLRVRYKGDDDEIVKSVEAGNVDLSLRGASLISASNQHKGLFGFKTESQLGPVKLTTIASLDKGEKNEIEISGGARSGGPIAILPNTFIQYRYYFLDLDYRENFRHFDANLNHVVDTTLAPTIVRLDVYKTVIGNAPENENAVPGWAFVNPSEPYRPGMQTDDGHIKGNYLLLQPEIDYTFNRDLGYIRLTRSIDDRTTLAVSYTTSRGNFGDPSPADNTEENPFILKLIQRASPQPTDVTWPLMWRNVYDLRSTSINEEAFNGRILFRSGGQAGEGSETGIDAAGNQRTFLAIFGLDQFTTSGPGEDGRIDGKFVNFPLGELVFPDLQPFAPIGWFKGGVPRPVLLVERDSLLYYTVQQQLNQVPSDFRIEVTYSSTSATYDLGIGVLEGSEEVLLSGARLSRGTDYTVDYLSGTLTILRRDALMPGADLKIRYEKGQLFQLDTKTMLGIRAEYDLGNNSFLAGTLLNLNQKTLDTRVRVGGEPLSNTVWGLNTRLNFSAPFLTSAVNALPLLSTDAPSSIEVSAEVAQVLPNPNNLNSPATGDNSGVAYIDDFESIKRATPLGLTRRQWNHASYPTEDSRGGGRWLRQRGRVIWYEPDPVKVSEIWPDRETQAQNSTTNVLKVEFQPWWTQWGAALPDGIDPTKSWGGIMRYLGAGYSDQSQSKYIEIWLHRGTAVNGSIYIDLGRISEDVIPDGRLNSEDKPRPGFQTGDGILNPGEDTGIDGVAGTDPADAAPINGLDQPPLPSYDDFSYSFSTRSDYSHINGSEGNGSGVVLEGGYVPDTEDLNGNNFLDQNNEYFRYRIDLTEGDQNRYIVGGLGRRADGRDTGWRLYRIPLADTLGFTIGRASLTQIEFVRLWFNGLPNRGAIQIASFDIVGNEWRESPVTSGGSTYDPVSIAVVNTHDNPEYNQVQPPGVAGEIDPVSGLRAKEQSLVVRVNRLGTGESGTIWKVLPQGQQLNLLEYRRIKMFVRGGGYSGLLKDRYGRDVDIEMFVRFAEDTTTRNARYYEYSQRLRPGWADENLIDIEIDRLSGLKFLREQDSLRDYDILPDGDVIRVVGEPSLRNVRALAIGIKNHGQEITALDNIEVWVDELRVSDIHRDPGWAATGGLSVKAAKFLDVRATVSQSQADFHNLNQRTSSDQSDKAVGALSTTLQLGEFFDPRWGVTIPLRGEFRQDMAVPKYKPNSDVRISALEGEQTDLWGKFGRSILNRDRFAVDRTYESPLDSMIATGKTYSLSLNLSKSKKSESPWIRWTLDPLSMGGNYSEAWRSDYRTNLNYRGSKRGEASYGLSFEKPWEVPWLRWAENWPVIGKFSETMLRPLPASVNISGDGTESLDANKPRTGRLVEGYRFDITRRYGASWRLLPILGFDFNGSQGATRIPEDSSRARIARGLVRLDSSAYWSRDTIPVFDSLRYSQDLAREIERIESEVFWKLFNYHFIDNTLTQSYSASFTPQFVSWLGTEANYRSGYQWNWTNLTDPGARGVGVGSTFNTTLTFRLTQFTSGWGGDAGGAKGQAPGGPGNGTGWGGGQPGFPGSGKGGSSGKPGGTLPGEPQFDPQSGEILADPGTPGWDPASGDFPPPEQFSESPIPATEDTTGGKGSAAPSDTAREKKPLITPPNPLDLLKSGIKRLKDISYNFTLANDTRNYAVAEGQADFAYRLGFTRDTGLPTVPGYLFRNSFSNRQEHRVSSGYDITRNLAFTTLEYQIVNSRSVGNRENGTFQRTVFQYFGDDGISIKKFPLVNYTLRWSGWEKLPFIEQIASSVTLDQSFRGTMTETWERASPDSARRTNNVAYEKNFQPLLGINFAWKNGIGSSARYNWSQQVTDERLGNAVKNRSTTQSIQVQGSYTARGGFKIPLYIFKSLDLKNNTTFNLTYNNQLSKREGSAGGAPFSLSSETASWSLSPSMEYAFSNAVRGGFRYSYNVQRNLLTGRTRSQEFSFRVNISIRG